jgi:hypothetical protein
MAEEQKILFEIYLENNQFKVRSKEVTDGLNNVGDGAQKAEGAFSKLKNSWVATTLAVGAVVLGFKKLFDALGNAVKAASKFQETQNKFNVIFKNNQKQAQDFAKTLVESYGLAKEEAMSFLAGTGDILTGLGMQSDKALELSNSVAQLGIDLASFSNIEGGAERAIHALTSALTGEREALKAYGIVVTEEMVTEELRRQHKEKLTGLSLQQAKAEATLAIALSQSGNAIGDMERSFDSYANIQRRVDSQLNDMQSTIGTELIPSMSNLGLAFLSASKDGNILATVFQTIVKLIGDVINGYALLIAYLNKFSASQKSDLGTQKAYMYLYKEQQQKIKEIYGSYENLEKMAKQGNNEAQSLLSLHLKTKDEARKLTKNNLEALNKEADANDTILKIKNNMANAEQVINQAIKDREKEKGNEDKPGAPKSDTKQKQADVAAYYEAINQNERAVAATLKQNKEKDLANAKLMYSQKLIDKQQYEQAVSTIEDTYRQQKLQAETEYHQQSVIANATAWQAKQQSQLAYWRASFGFESKAFQGSMMIAQAGMTLMNSKNKALFRVGQAATVANIIMSTAEAIMKGFSYGPAIGIPYSILVGTAAGVQTANTLGQKPPGDAKIKMPTLNMPSFAVGAWQVPSDMVAQIHKDEMIIPKTFADSVRSETSGSAAGNIYITVQGSVVDTHGLLEVVDDAQERRARLMGAKKYTMKSAY